MTTPEMIRCKDCAYLIEDDDGDWVAMTGVKIFTMSRTMTVRCIKNGIGEYKTNF